MDEIYCSRVCGWDLAEWLEHLAVNAKIATVHTKCQLFDYCSMFVQWTRSSPSLWMRSSRVVRASGCQCQSRNSPRFDPSILQHSRIWGAADEAVLNNVHKKEKNPKKSPFYVCTEGNYQLKRSRISAKNSQRMTQNRARDWFAGVQFYLFVVWFGSLVDPELGLFNQQS